VAGGAERAALSALEILLRGAAAGVLVATAIGMLRGRGAPEVRWAGALSCLSAAAFGVHSEGAETQALGPLRPVASLLSAGGTGYFWLFAVTLFGPRRFAWRQLGPIALLTGIAMIGWSLPPESARGLWIAHNALEIALVASASLAILGSWRDDLVESRRSLRGPFLAAVALYAISLSGFEIAEAAGFAPAWAGMAQAATLAVVALGGASVFLSAQPDLFEARPRPRERGGPDARDAALLAKLDAEMKLREAWRREGLTIGALAEALGVPEHRLRRLVNRQLGHRNFSEFVSVHRIAAAQRELADPAHAERSISEIAFALGYASLGPFNRAFKEATGATPSAFRAQALAAEPSPNPEMPR
jgi:AraC-like DNA-binding protein